MLKTSCRGCGSSITIKTRSVFLNECPFDGMIAGAAKAINGLYPGVVAEENNHKFARTSRTVALDQVFYHSPSFSNSYAPQNCLVILDRLR